MFNIFKKDSSEDVGKSDEQLVKLTFILSGSDLGDTVEQKHIYELEDELEEALGIQEVGDVDGHEFGDDNCEVYVYGADADSVLEAIRPILEKCPLKPIRVLQRYGGVGNKNAKEKESIIT